MAHNLTAEILPDVRRIVTGVIDFKGRSDRSEFGIFVIAMIVINSVMLILSRVVTRDFSIPLNQYQMLALWGFGIPLFARRLNDQNRSGWLALILPVLLTLRLYAQILYDAGQLPIADVRYPFNVAERLLLIAFWALVIWPGTAGENRFGPEPRQSSKIRGHYT